MTEHNDNGPGPDFVQVGQIDPQKIVPEAFADWLGQPVVDIPLSFVPEPKNGERVIFAGPPGAA